MIFMEQSPMDGDDVGGGGAGEAVEQVPEGPQAGDPTGGGQDVGHEPGDRAPAEPDPAAELAGDGLQTGEAAEEPEVPAYTPDFKLKVLDKDHEVPERFRALMTDPESANEVRDVFTKAYAMETMKQSRNDWAQKFNGLNGSVQQINQALSKGDLHSAFGLMRLSEDAVLRHAMELVAYRQATPEQRAAHDAQRDTAMRLAALEQQNQQLLGSHQERETTQRGQELDIALATPEVSQVAQSFDARAGRVGAFRDEVIRRGQFYWATAQQDIPVGQAIKEVLLLTGGQTAPVVRTASSAPASGAASQPRQVASGAPRAPEKKPVIPNFAGSGQSPAQVVPRSIKELRKLGQEARRGA